MANMLISGIFLGMGSANKRQHYIVTLSIIGWAHTQNDPWSTSSISYEICTWFCSVLLFSYLFSVIIEFVWFIYPYSSGLLHWHWDNCVIVPVPVKLPWIIWLKSTLTKPEPNTKCETMWVFHGMYCMSSLTHWPLGDFNKILEKWFSS